MQLREALPFVALGALLSACGSPSSIAPNASAVVAPASSSSATEFVGFWQSWSDTDRNDAFSRLTQVPGSVTSIDVAFSIADSNQISPPQNTYPLKPGARHVHHNGGKVLLSFGGATSPFDITNAQQFATNLQAYVKANAGVYDGFDFDDEVIPQNGQQQLIGVLQAVRSAFPAAVITFDAFIDGADTGPGSGHQGEDIAIVQAAGSAIDYLNVMAYDAYGWKPTGHPDCSYQEGSKDDCRLDVLQEFAAIKMSNDQTFPKNKIVLGLMIGKADDGTIITPQNASAYARDVRSGGYRGMMIWDLDLDNPQAPPDGTGHPKGTYVRAIAKALGT